MIHYHFIYDIPSRAPL